MLVYQEDKMKFNQGFDIIADTHNMVFKYGQDVFGPLVENRKLKDIQNSLRDKLSSGPDIVYSIAMDVGRNEDKQDLVNRNLLYGSVIYSQGKLGSEPIRSQGHIHAISKSCGMSTPEVYEIWSGKAYIYMQESAKDQPGRCFAVKGEPGDVIIVPPGWAHATISADVNEPLVFGAWCVRDYGFDYVDVREHNGLAYFPLIDDAHEIIWEKNPTYNESQLEVKRPRKYMELGIIENMSIYEQYVKEPSKFDFVTNPNRIRDIWEKFIP